MRTRTTVRAAVPVTVLMLALAGCSGSDSADEPTGQATSPTVSTASPSPSESPTEAVDTGGLSRDELVAAMQAAIKDKKTAHTTMQLSTAQGLIDAEGDVSYAGGTSMAMTMQIPGMGKAEMRVLDGIIYMAMPPLTPEGKFLKIDPDDPNGPLGGQFSGLGDQLDPLRSFGAFDKGLKKVEYVGEESVDGEDMDHYVLTVDSKASMEALGQQVPEGLPETTTYDLWLDQDNLMRRMKMSLSGLSMDMAVNDWGKPVDIKAPPRDDVMLLPGTAGN